MTASTEGLAPSPDPYRAILDACDHAALQGVPVALTGEWGVVAGSRFGTPHWFRGDVRRPIDPLSAVLLVLQPDVVADPMMAVGNALGIGQPEMAGIVAGMDRQEPSLVWMGTPARRLYVSGYQTGVRLRMSLMTRVCKTLGCGRRVTHGKPCPKCGEVA